MPDLCGSDLVDGDFPPEYQPRLSSSREHRSKTFRWRARDHPRHRARSRIDVIEPAKDL
jgi:hypothetical protein